MVSFYTIHSSRKAKENSFSESKHLIDESKKQISLDAVMESRNLTTEIIYLFSRLVTFDWLKSSSHIGEWLSVNKFEPKGLYQTYPSLSIYRKFRQQQKPILLFNQRGLIYLTSIAKQRPLLLKLITLLGGNVSFLYRELIRNLYLIVDYRES
jgi:hypothetical protein